MKANSVSLIVATRGRTKELKRLLDSLVAQTYQGFEVIIVDQNEDDRLVDLLQGFACMLTIHHARSDIYGKAAAGNVGLRMCRGDIVTFPDDDCWYPPELLRRVIDMFEAHPGWHGVTGCEVAIDMAVRFDQEPGQVTQQNIWRRHQSFSLFLRRANVAGLFYDERLGVGAGTIWGSGEETDFLLRFIKGGSFVQYEPSLAVYHPDWSQGPYTPAAIKKARRYGMGMGRVLQTHGFPASLTLKYLARPLLGATYTLIRGKPRKAAFYWATFLGRTTGWVVSLVSQNHEPEGAPWLNAK